MNFLNLLLAANVLISWTAPPGATGYKIYTGTKSGVYDGETTAIAFKLESFTLKNVPDNVLFFAVSALYPSGIESAKSNEVSLAPITGAPSNVCLINPFISCEQLEQNYDKLKSNYDNCELNNFQMYRAWQDSLAAKIKAEKELAACKKKYPKGCK